MAMWGAIAAAAIGAAAQIYMSETAGKGKPPVSGTVGGKKPFEMPDIFKNKGGSMMGGGSPDIPLSQSLLHQRQTPPAQVQPSYGPAPGAMNALEDMEQRRRFQSLMGR